MLIKCGLKGTNRLYWKKKILCKMKRVNKGITDTLHPLISSHSLSLRHTLSSIHRSRWSTEHGLVFLLRLSPPSISPTQPLPDTPPPIPPAPRASARALLRHLPAPTSRHYPTMWWWGSPPPSTTPTSARRLSCAARGVRRCGRYGRPWCCYAGGSASSMVAAMSAPTPTRRSIRSWKLPLAAPPSPWLTPASFTGREGRSSRPWNCISGPRNLETLLRSAIWEFPISKVFISSLP